METVDLKLVLLGQPGVGKTCLVYRYLYNTFGRRAAVQLGDLGHGGTGALRLALQLLLPWSSRGHHLL